MRKPMMRPIAVVLAAMGWLAHAQAGSYTVPQGVAKLEVTLAGGGGGAGGSDFEGGLGGAGTKGAKLTVEFSVPPGTVGDYVEGEPGLGGQQWVNPTTVAMKGGVGGSGSGSGGAGGDAPMANTNGYSASGGAGGGGGASSVQFGSLWARAGGGGGGGGGSWKVPAIGAAAATQPTAAVSTADCATQGAGQVGQAGTPDRAPHAETGPGAGDGTGGGGGGGGGGGYIGAGGQGGAAGFDDKDPGGAAAGNTGGSCYSPGVAMSTFEVDGGGDGGAAPTAASDGSKGQPDGNVGTKGSVSIAPIMAKAIVNPSAGVSVITLDVGPLANMGITDASAITDYAFTCTPQGGGTPLTWSGATLTPLPTIPASNGVTYDCQVEITVADPNNPSSTGLKLVVSDPVPVTPAALAPLQPPVAVTTSGDGEGSVGLTSLPPGVQPGDVKDYTVTCNTTTPPVNTTVATLPLPVTGLTNGQSYPCQVVVNLKDGRSSPPSAAVDINPTATPVATTATPVPGLGGAGVVLLSGLVAALGLRRKRKQ